MFVYKHQLSIQLEGTSKANSQWECAWQQKLVKHFGRIPTREDQIRLAQILDILKLPVEPSTSAPLTCQVARDGLAGDGSHVRSDW